VVGGDSPESTAVRLALLAFVADMAAYVAVGWGWGRRPAAVYLLLGLPLLPMLYQRFDLVSVAFAAWGAALLRVRTDDAGAAGVALGLAIWAKLWPVVLVPVLLLRRARTSLIAVGALALVGGAAWYLRGGKKAPFQVLTLRDAVGWSVEGTVGSVLRAVGAAGPTSNDGNTVRFGTVPGLAAPLLFLLMVAVVALIWWLAAADARETSGGPSLAAVAALLVCAPFVAAQYLSWLLPWAAIAFEGDERERRVATAAVVAIALTGLTQLVTVGDGWIDAALLLARNIALVAVVGVWLAPFALPRRTA
jgi:hypothetical protein